MEKDIEITVTGKFFKQYFQNINDTVEYENERKLMLKTKVFARMSVDKK